VQRLDGRDRLPTTDRIARLDRGLARAWRGAEDANEWCTYIQRALTLRLFRDRGRLGNFVPVRHIELGRSKRWRDRGRGRLAQRQVEAVRGMLDGDLLDVATVHQADQLT